MKNALYNFIEKVTPRPLWAIAATTVAAYRTLFKTGFFRSVIRERSEDRNGNPIPWFTYPALAYLAQLDLSDKSVFEWGSGWSTWYWAKRCKTVTSIEDNQKWMSLVLAQINRHGFRNVIMESAPSSSLAYILSRFDICVIDGSARKACCIQAYNAEVPMIILDDSEMLPDSVALLSVCYHHIPFAGLGPISHTPKVTSVFLRKEPCKNKNAE